MTGVKGGYDSYLGGLRQSCLTFSGVMTELSRGVMTII